MKINLVKIKYDISRNKLKKKLKKKKKIQIGWTFEIENEKRNA